MSKTRNNIYFTSRGGYMQRNSIFAIQTKLKNNSNLTLSKNELVISSITFSQFYKIQTISNKYKITVEFQPDGVLMNFANVTGQLRINKNSMTAEVLHSFLRELYSSQLITNSDLFHVLLNHMTKKQLQTFVSQKSYHFAEYDFLDDLFNEKLISKNEYADALSELLEEQHDYQLISQSDYYQFKDKLLAKLLDNDVIDPKTYYQTKAKLIDIRYKNGDIRDQDYYSLRAQILSCQLAEKYISKREFYSTAHAVLDKEHCSYLANKYYFDEKRRLISAELSDEMITSQEFKKAMLDISEQEANTFDDIKEDLNELKQISFRN